MTKRKTKSTPMTAPVYIQKLIDAGLSHAEIGREIGRTGETISSALRTGKASLVTELAARGVYERQVNVKAAASSGVAVIKGEMHHLHTVRDLLASVGGTFTLV